ncbi:MAG: crossover junction endodeoxyribonuclease RuvC, partial [Anaerolineales bacterium]|nr:crossover junction endodeoxyribonuclease RuvC [Anaerolineales bacterium]
MRLRRLKPLGNVGCMLVIGVDPGTASTGYGLVRQIQGGELELVDYGVFTTPSDQCMSKRLVKLYDDLTTLLALHRLDSGAVEQLFFQKNVTT